MPRDPLANFVATQNIVRFRALLAVETHPDKREILIELLAQEEAKHLAASRPDRWTQ
ncbi:MAG: hypothetical protein ABJA75_05350 [Bradyrhizobium sp.]